MLRYRPDWLLWLPVLLLVVLGLTVLQSVVPELVPQQLIFIALGLILSLGVSWIHYRVYEHFSGILYFLSLLLLLITLLIGQVTRGSVRWIPLGLFNLQTSELAKPLLIIFFARYLSQTKLVKLKAVFISILLFMLPTILVFRQPDLGSTIIITAIWLGMMFAAGLPWRYFFVGIVAVGLILPLAWQLLAPYQKSRLITFINPLSDPLKSGYHLNQSLIAVGSGQIFGRGLGQGTQSQLRFLPERHTDFIFASLAEELGLVGGVILVALLTAVLVRILKISTLVHDQFGTLICLGVFSLLAFQGFINLGMNIGLVPITGITLPLISYGGSSLLSTFISLGLVSSISSYHQERHPFEIR